MVFFCPRGFRCTCTCVADVAVISSSAEQTFLSAMHITVAIHQTSSAKNLSTFVNRNPFISLKNTLSGNKI